MNITGVTVAFSRSRQPAQYESAKAEVTLTASIGETEAEANPNIAEVVSATLLAKAAAAVYSQLGLNVAPRAVATPDAATEEAPVVPLKPRGRPKKDAASQTTSAPSETTTAAPSTTAAPASAAASQEPWEAEAPAAAEPSKDVTDNDLQAAASKAAQNVGTDKVKALIAEFKVARLGQLNQPQRVEFLTKLRKLTRDE